MNVDGSDQRLLSAGVTTSWGPRWSPDGGRIAFTRPGADDFYQVWVISASGGSPTQITSGGPPGRVVFDWGLAAPWPALARGAVTCRLSAYHRQTVYR